MTTPWHLGPLAPFDVESTGADVEVDQIVTPTVARITPGKPTQVASHLVAVERDIHPEATAVHGITTEDARANGKPPVEVLDVVAADLALAMSADVPVVGMNLVFDFTMLDRELRRHRLPLLEDRLGRAIGPVIDVFVLDKRIDTFRPGKRKLTDLCAHYGVRIDGAHNAEFDALAAARIAYRIGQRAHKTLPELCDIYAARRYPAEVARLVMGLKDMTVWDLHEAQKGWYAEQATGLAAHWRRQAEQIVNDAIPSLPDYDEEMARADELRARADSVTTDWPIRPYAPPAAPVAEQWELIG